jgi:hypothetical protein
MVQGRVAAPVSKSAAAATPLAAARGEMLDVEAWLAVEALDVAQAASAVRSAAKRSGGDVVDDTVNDAAGGMSAVLTLRVPAEQTDALLGAVEASGASSRAGSPRATLTRSVFDAELRLENLSV